MLAKSMKLLGATAVALGIVGMVSAAHAQRDFPSKPVTIVVPWPAGTIPDTAFRVLGKLASDDLGQPVVVQNVVGGSGSKGTQFVANSDPDGHTLLNNWVAPHVVVPLFNPDVGYSDESFEPLFKALVNPFTVTVPMNHPAQTLPEFVEWARAEADQRTLNVGICAALSVPRMVMETFLIEQVGITNFNPVPFPGCMPDNVKAVLDGTVDFTTGVFIAPRVFEGLVRNLAVFAENRFANNPDLPTIKEFGLDPGFGEAGMGWAGLVAPAGTPDLRLKVLRDVLGKWIQSDEFKSRMDELGIQVDYAPADEFKQLWVDARVVLEPPVQRLLASQRQ